MEGSNLTVFLLLGRGRGSLFGNFKPVYVCCVAVGQIITSIYIEIQHLAPAKMKCDNGPERIWVVT